MEMEVCDIQLPPELREVLTKTPELKRSYLVGGCVRDGLLGIEHKDYDIEVYGLNYEELAAALGRWGRTDLVGRCFGVVKWSAPGGATHDFSIPRMDSKTGPGHKGFEVRFDPDITLEQAASRRDFTVNALMWDPRSHKLLDYFGGSKDLQQGLLRHTSPSFTEDPLRVLRGMQLCARYRLRPAEETLALCRSIKHTYQELAVERVWEEWFKWASLSVRPSFGLSFLQATEWLENFPELHALAATEQDPEWHPEGDVLTHTRLCCDAMAGLPGWRTADVSSRVVYMLGILTHDSGKPKTTERSTKGGMERIVSYGHVEEGEEAARRFLERIHAPRAVVQRVLPLVGNHLAHLQPVTDRSIRRLAKRLHPETIPGLCLVITADHMGRPPKEAVVPASVFEIIACSVALKVQAGAPPPILSGRHLLELGMEPGPLVGRILREAYEAQLEGNFSDLETAHLWLARQERVEVSEGIRSAAENCVQRS